MKRSLASLTLLGIAVVLSAAPASAQGDKEKAAGTSLKAVVELYTSQGCSSCPPADALLKTYAERADIVALTLPVDYWDYLGWKDTYASQKNSERQRAYAKGRGDGAIYTPQMVINGATHVNGAHRDEIDAAIAKAAAHFVTGQVPVRIWSEGSGLMIEVGKNESAKLADATVWVAAVQATGQVAVRKGENVGRSLTYTNIVRELTPVGMLSGKPNTFRIERSAVMPAGTERGAVLVQSGTGGPIVGAAWLGKW